MAISVRDGGIWKEAKPWVKDGGVWKEVQKAWVKDGGIWKETYSGKIALTGSWETGLDGWTLLASTSRVASNPRTGSYALLHNSGVTPTYAQINLPVSITSGKRFRLSTYSKGSWIYLAIENGNGSTSFAFLSAASTASYTLCTIEMPNPASTELRFGIGGRSGAYTDDWSIEEI